MPLPRLHKQRHIPEATSCREERESLKPSIQCNIHVHVYLYIHMNKRTCRIHTDTESTGCLAHIHAPPDPSRSTERDPKATPGLRASRGSSSCAACPGAPPWRSRWAFREVLGPCWIASGLYIHKCLHIHVHRCIRI